MSNNQSHLYRFGEYQLDATERILKRDGEIVPLPLKPLAVLLVLVEHHGKVVSKEELMRRVWPESYVDEANLARHIYLLRQTLSDNHKSIGAKGVNHHYIQTIPGRGYRFVSEVETEHAASGVEDRQQIFQSYEATTERQDQSHFPLTQVEGSLDLASISLTVEPYRAPRLSGSRVLTAMLALSTLVLLVILLFTRQAGKDEPPTEMAITRLTNNLNVLAGWVSPDGKYIVSTVEENGQRSLWVRSLSGGSERQIVPPISFDLGGISFSPDSSFVYYNISTKQSRTATLYQIPIIGGTARKIREGLYSPVSFAPDGLRFAFVREDHARGRSSLLISSLNDEAERELIARKTPEYLDYPVWSPDGSRIVCTFNPETGGSQLLVVRVNDGAERPLPTPAWRYIRTPIWVGDGSGLVVNAEESFLFNQVWFLPFGSDGKHAPRRLTNGMRVWRGLSLTSDAREMVLTERSRIANVWVANSSAAGRATQITSGAGHYEDLTWTPDRQLLYCSDATGFWNIWMMKADGTSRRQLTFDQHENRMPSMSPAGRYIFFTSIRNGASSIWRMDRDGANLKQITFGGNDFAPHSTPDGQWLLFTSQTNESAFALRKAPIEGDGPVTLIRNEVRDGIISPDGKYIACLLTEGLSSRSIVAMDLAVLSLADGAVRKLNVIDPHKISHNKNKLHWTPDSSGIVYTDSGDAYRNLWIQPLAGGKPRQLTDYYSDQIFGFDISRDGRIAVLRGAVRNEIVRISNPNLKPGIR